MRLNLAWSNIFCSLAVCLVLWKWFVAGPASDSHHLSLIASGGDVLWMCYRGTAWHYPWAALGKEAVAVFWRDLPCSGYQEWVSTRLVYEKIICKVSLVVVLEHWGLVEGIRCRFHLCGSSSLLLLLPVLTNTSLCCLCPCSGGEAGRSFIDAKEALGMGGCWLRALELLALKVVRGKLGFLRLHTHVRLG